MQWIINCIRPHAHDGNNAYTILQGVKNGFAQDYRAAYSFTAESSQHQSFMGNEVTRLTATICLLSHRQTKRQRDLRNSRKYVWMSTFAANISTCMFPVVNLLADYPD